MSIQNNFPNIKPALLLDFAKTKRLDPRITFTRASPATYYDGKTVAKAEENLLRFSQEFNSAAWIKNRVTVTANSEVAPDGTTTADKIIATATDDGGHACRQIFIYTTGLVFTISVFAKAAEYSNLFISDVSNRTMACAYDLSAGTAGTPLLSGPFTNVTASIQNVGNGWFRCSLTGTSNTSNPRTPSFAGFPSEAVLNANHAEYTGDGTSGIFLWGAQLEQRSAITAYTPTTTQAVTNYIPQLLTAPAGVARFDHNPITRESLGLLVEQSRTNLLTNSESFVGFFNCTTLSNQITAPNGTVTATGVSATAAGQFFYSAKDLSNFVADTTYTFSIYVKRGSTDRIKMSSNASALFNGSAIFDLTNASVISGIGVIRSCGNGWFRCSITGTGTTSGGQVVYAIPVTPGGTTQYIAAYAGEVGIYQWGTQLEVGAFPTSYIKTEATAVTRNRDVAYIPVDGWFTNSEEGTMYAELEPRNTVTDTNVVYFGLYGSSSLINGDDRGFTLYNRFNYLSRNPTSASPNLNFQMGPSKIILAMDSLGKYGVKNGNSVISWLGDGNNIIGAKVLSLAGNSSGGDYNQTMKKIAYYRTRLSNTQLQSLTR